MTFPPALLRVSVAGWLTMMGWTLAEGAPKHAAPAPSGIITGLTGTPSVVGNTSAPSRPFSLGDTVPSGHEVRTNQDDTMEILWGQRTLIQVQPHTSITIEELKDGQVTLRLPSGSVRVALAYGGPATDLVTVQTPTGRVFTRGGIVEVDVLPSPPSFFSRVSSTFSGADAPAPSARVETVRVLEGQSGLEPLGGSGKSEMLEAGVEARVASGVVQHLSHLPAGLDRGLGLAPADRRQSTPLQLAQRIARVHVDHALEVERLTNAANASLESKDITAGSDLKGAVVATSLGVPTISLSTAQVAGTGSSPIATSPVPALSPVQGPTITTLGGNQSGGLNSKSILNDVLSDTKGKGSKDKGKGH